MSLRLRMLKYTADPNQSLRGAYMVAETEMKQMLAEKDLLHSMKAEKELELWRRMKTTMEQGNGNANSPSVLALLSQIKMVVAEEENSLSKYRLDGNQGNPLQNFITPPQNFSTSFYQASQLKEVPNPYPPIDSRVTKVKDTHLPGPPFGPSRNQPGNQLPYNVQGQWQAGNYQGENKSSAGPSYQCPKPAYENSDWRANSGPRIFDPSKSLNPYINGSRMHRYSSDNPLCFKCGISGHKSMDQQCTSSPLSQGEQLYLKQMIYDDIQKLRAPGPAVSQSNMAHTEFIQNAWYDDLQDTLPPSVNSFMSKEKKEEKTKLESKNCQSSLSSYQGTVRVELEDKTLKDVELSSLIDIAGIKRRCVRHKRPTVENNVEEIPQKDIPPSSTYIAADGRKKLTPKRKGLSKKKGFSSNCRNDRRTRGRHAKSAHGDKYDTAVATTDADITIV
ncbi:hypothetical protein MMC29_006117 [Sticta canariensis]|nr:hypothetical protein [Sticta canariensis]